MARAMVHGRNQPHHGVAMVETNEASPKIGRRRRRRRRRRRQTDDTLDAVARGSTRIAQRPTLENSLETQPYTVLREFSVL